MKRQTKEYIYGVARKEWDEAVDAVLMLGKLPPFLWGSGAEHPTFITSKTRPAITIPKELLVGFNLYSFLNLDIHTYFWTGQLRTYLNQHG